MRERDRLLGLGVGGALKKSAEEVTEKSASEEAEKKDGEHGEWEDVEEGDVGNVKKEQKVYVLERGFVGWQEKYGTDERLTEAYSKELWEDGYWM